MIINTKTTLEDDDNIIMIIWLNICASIIKDAYMFAFGFICNWLINKRTQTKWCSRVDDGRRV